MKKWAIYMHVCPNGLCYIGKTSRAPIVRWTSGNKYQGNIDFYSAIQLNGGENNFLTAFKHYVLSADAETWIEWHRDLSFDETNIFTEEEAEIFEKLWIDIYDTMNPQKGYNRTTGGDRDYKISELAKEHNVKAHEGMYYGADNPFWGKRHSAETREKLSQLAKLRTGSKNPFYGKVHTQETKIKNRQAHIGIYDGEKNPFFGHHHTEETKHLLSTQHKKTISSYDLTGKRLHTYPSVSEAAETMGVTITTISDCATRNTKTSCGLIWRFSDAEQLPESELPCNHALCKAIAQHSLTGEFIKTFSSLKSAAAATGLSTTAISNAALGKTRQSGGYIWRYVNTHLSNKDNNA